MGVESHAFDTTQELVANNFPGLIKWGTPTNRWQINDYE